MPGRAPLTDADAASGTRPRHTSRRTLLVAATVATAVTVPLVLLLRPAGAVDVDSARPDGAALGACRALVAGLPQTLDGAPRRAVDPDDGTTAAWGAPAIVLRCGVPAPDPVTVQCVGVEGVDWAWLRRGAAPPDGHEEGSSDGSGHEERAGGGPDLGFAFRTYGREPVVEVVVPPEHAPEAEVLVPLAGFAAALPQGELRCTGAGAR